MKTDAQLKSDVTRELEWDPSINAAHVGVSAKGGVVTLTGHIETYAEKSAIEHAVQRVEGVRAVAVELDVRLAPEHRRSDSDIAEAAKSAFKWGALVPDESIRARIEKGWVTLTGEVEWAFQRLNAEKAVRGLTGVVGVSNQITIKPKVAPDNISSRIREALERHARREAAHVEVVVSNSKVTLRGHVDSWAERRVASGAAWSAPGITEVVNELSVGTPT